MASLSCHGPTRVRYLGDKDGSNASCRVSAEAEPDGPMAPERTNFASVPNSRQRTPGPCFRGQLDRPLLGYESREQQDD